MKSDLKKSKNEFINNIDNTPNRSRNSVNKTNNSLILDNNPFNYNNISNIGSGSNKIFEVVTAKNSNKKSQKATINKKKTFVVDEVDLDSDEVDGALVSNKDDKRNLRNHVLTKRNLFFQLISKTEIAIELDFPIEDKILTIIQNHKGKLDADLPLYIAPYENYQIIMDELNDSDNFKGFERIKIFPISEIAKVVLENIEFEKIKFKEGNKSKQEYIIDYSRDEVKSLKDLPENVVKNLYQFQRDGVEFALSRFGRLLLADEMGIGKTIQSVAIAGIYTEDWPVLILCPGAVKSCWKNEILHWLDYLITDPSEVQIIKTSKDKFSGDAKFYVLTYTLAFFLKDVLKNKNFKFVIVDECHALKNMKTKRYQALMPIIRKCKRLLLLSGTPILANPVEAFHVVHALRPDIFPNFSQFGNRYCDPKLTPFGMNWSGVSNTKELHFVISTMMIRRLKKDVLSQLPPKNRQKVSLECDTEIVRKVKRYIDSRRLGILEKEGKDNGVDGKLSEDQKETEEQESSKEELENNSENMKKNKKGKSNIEDETPLTFAEAYSLTGMAKLKGIRDYINYLLENNCKFIIFAYHIAVLNNIEEFLQEFGVEYIRIDGKVQNENRDLAVETFQKDDNCRVALLGITACATGITLTAASTVLFAELYFTPAIMIQAEDRAHRIGQQHNCVNIHYLYAKHTIDDIIFPRLRAKYFVVTTTLDNKKMELGLQNVSSGIVGDFSNDKGIVSQSRIIEDEMEDFKIELENKYGIIFNEKEIEESIETDVLGKINFHQDDAKRQRNEDNELSDEDETNITSVDDDFDFPKTRVKLECKDID